MTDYYPIIARAVSSLGHTTLETRQTLYERVRMILSAELNSQNPPLSGAEIIREMRALEAGIQEVEAELLRTDHQPLEPTIENQTTAPAEEPATAPAEKQAQAPAAEKLASVPARERPVARPPKLQPKQIDEVYIDDGLRKKERAPIKKRPPKVRFETPKIYKDISGLVPPVVTKALKSFGGTRLALVGLAASATLTVIYIFGLEWLFKHVFRYLMVPVLVALVLCVFVFVPMSLSPQRRVTAVYGFVISSYLFAIATLMMGILTTLEYLGVIGVAIGLILGIVGVIPVGLIAAAFNADWSSVAILLVSVFVTWTTRILGFGLAESVDPATTISEDNDNESASTRWALFPEIMKPKRKSGSAQKAV